MFFNQAINVINVLQIIQFNSYPLQVFKLFLFHSGRLVNELN